MFTKKRKVSSKNRAKIAENGVDSLFSSVHPPFSDTKVQNYEDLYSRQITDTSNEIQLKVATKSMRAGRGRARDAVVFGKMAWSEAFSYISPVQTALIFAALITPAVEFVNIALLKISETFDISDPFQFPIEYVAVFSLLALIFILVFGVISVRHAGTYRATNEISCKMHPGFRLLWKNQQELMKEIRELKKEVVFVKRGEEKDES